MSTGAAPAASRTSSRRVADTGAPVDSPLTTTASAKPRSTVSRVALVVRDGRLFRREI